MFNTIILLSALAAILMVIGWLIGGMIGITAALVLAVAINAAAYWYSDTIVLRMYNAKPTDDKRLDSLISKVAHEFKMPKPRMYIVERKAPNAFATGRDKRKGVIVVTEGLLQLEDSELRAVLSHELAHIKNRDVLVATIAATLGAAISYIAQIGYWSIFLGSGRRSQENLFGIILIAVFAPIAALLIRLAVSRRREYKADQSAAFIDKSPRALASALRKIAAMAKEDPIQGNSATSHLWIVNPFHRDWFTGLFSTHPPLEKRIKRLERMVHK